MEAIAEVRLGVRPTYTLTSVPPQPKRARSRRASGRSLIIGWVGMWRPLEAVLYDWWPFVAKRRLHDRVLGASLSVRFGRGPAPSA